MNDCPHDAVVNYPTVQANQPIVRSIGTLLVDHLDLAGHDEAGPPLRHGLGGILIIGLGFAVAVGEQVNQILRAELLPIQRLQFVNAHREIAESRRLPLQAGFGGVEIAHQCIRVAPDRDRCFQHCSLPGTTVKPDVEQDRPPLQLLHQGCGEGHSQHSPCNGCGAHLPSESFPCAIVSLGMERLDQLQPIHVLMDESYRLVGIIREKLVTLPAKPGHGLPDGEQFNIHCFKVP